MNRTQIIEELKKLCEFQTIYIDTFFDDNLFEYGPIKLLIEQFKLKAKPESATSELFRQIIKDVLGLKITPEVNYEGAFVDYTIHEKEQGNPVLVEIKPLFKRSLKATTLTRFEFKYYLYQDQIQKYLKNPSLRGVFFLYAIYKLSTK